MKRSALLFFILIVSTYDSLNAQTIASLDWHEGAVVTLLGDSITGHVFYDRQKKLILLASRSKFRAYSFHAVKSFAYYDGDLHMIRSFSTYNLTRYSGRHEVYEQLVTGKYHFLEKSMKSIYDQKETGFVSSLDRKISRSHYYLWNEGRPERVGNFKKQFLSMCNEHHKEMIKQYVRHKGITYSEPQHQAMIVSFANRLEEGDILASR
ncbi:MAG: hypothetical protein AAFX87_24740 [Bacteroidota bacterium]